MRTNMSYLDMCTDCKAKSDAQRRTKAIFHSAVESIYARLVETGFTVDGVERVLRTVQDKIDEAKTTAKLKRE